MWQTSDNVPKEIITICSKTCDKIECRFSARIGETTCAATSNFYDKDGNHIIKDNNYKTVDVICGICNRAWIVDHRQGNMTAIEYDLKGKLNAKL